MRSCGAAARTITVPGLVAVELRRHLRDHAPEGILSADCAVALHVGDTVETVSRTYVHWLRDDQDIPAQVLDRMLGPVSQACHEGDAAGE